MSNRTHAAEAAELFAKNANSAQAMRVIAFYYMTKFPQYAAQAVSAAECFPGPAFASAGVDNGNVDITVPAGSNVHGTWPEANYRCPLKWVREWKRIYSTDSGFVSSKVAAIKQCRADTLLGLKQAKDLVEYIASKEW